MPVAITFDYKQKYTVGWDAFGDVQTIPLMPASPGLYIIRNKQNGGQVYAGTTSNLRQRFGERCRVYRESSFPGAVLAEVRFYRILLKVDDVSRRVDDHGKAQPRDGEIDVEHLLIRSIVVHAGCRVTNVMKWGLFANPYGQRLDVEFDNFPHSLAFCTPANFSLASRATF